MPIVAFFTLIILLAYEGTFGAEVPSIPKDKTKFHIFLLMGQSNMEGHASVDGEMDTETNSRILKLNASGFWEVAKDPISNYSTFAVGPGFQFAKELVAADPDITIGLIPLAVGGTNLEWWSKPGAKYDESIYMAHLAQQQGTLCGILWHQGEHDSYIEGLANSYDTRLKLLIDHLRMDTRDAYLPFIIGGFTNAPEIDDVLRSRVSHRLIWVGTQFPRCAYVPTGSIPYRFDNPLHFTSDGQRLLGKGYASAYLNLSGFWTEKGKAWLDSEAEDMESGWKYHPDLGLYYDVNFPLIKHAQLGWLTVSIDENHVIHLDSPFLGTFDVMQNDGFAHAIYIYHVNREDPEHPVYGVPFYVNLLREPGDPYAFYDHSINAYLDRLPGMTVVKSTWDLNSMVESEFEATQWQAQYLKNEIAANGSWSKMRDFVDKIVYHRNYTNVIGWEGYRYSREHESGNLKTFWMNKFLERLYYIDTYVVEAQSEYQSATDVKLYP